MGCILLLFVYNGRRVKMGYLVIFFYFGFLSWNFPKCSRVLFLTARFHNHFYPFLTNFSRFRERFRKRLLLSFEVIQLSNIINCLINVFHSKFHLFLFHPNLSPPNTAIIYYIPFYSPLSIPLSSPLLQTIRRLFEGRVAHAFRVDVKKQVYIICIYSFR